MYTDNIKLALYEACEAGEIDTYDRDMMLDRIGDSYCENYEDDYDNYYEGLSDVKDTIIRTIKVVLEKIKMLVKKAIIKISEIVSKTNAKRKLAKLKEIVSQNKERYVNVVVQYYDLKRYTDSYIKDMNTAITPAIKMFKMSKTTNIFQKFGRAINNIIEKLTAKYVDKSGSIVNTLPQNRVRTHTSVDVGYNFESFVNDIYIGDACSYIARDIERVSVHIKKIDAGATDLINIIEDAVYTENQSPEYTSLITGIINTIYTCTFSTIKNVLIAFNQNVKYTLVSSENPKAFGYVDNDRPRNLNNARDKYNVDAEWTDRAADIYRKNLNRRFGAYRPSTVMSGQDLTNARSSLYGSKNRYNRLQNKYDDDKSLLDFMD